MPATLAKTMQGTCDLHVTGPKGHGAGALLRLLVDAGRHQGLSPVSVVAGPHLPGDRPETHSARLSTPCGKSVRVTAVLQPHLMHMAGEGFLVMNCKDRVDTETVRSLDADGIARKLGIPSYLPMVGAIARVAGWTDLDRIKSVVRFALEDTAPYWVEQGLEGVAAGYAALE